VLLRLTRSLSASQRSVITRILAGLPPFAGNPISLSFQPQLTAYRGGLLSGSPQLGVEVHAAAFIRRRQIVMENALLRNPDTLRLILTHEIFHFVWARLGNSPRREYADILARELRAGARGELGESAGIKKDALGKLPFDSELSKSDRWRDYVCESFCDTAAYFYSESLGHAEFQLAARWRQIRRRWFFSVFASARPF
jgi:hypothetical protein